MTTLKDRLRELERMEIVNALRETGWVMARAARNLGITERMIGYKIRKYGIRRDAEAANTDDPEQRGTSTPTAEPPASRMGFDSNGKNEMISAINTTAIAAKEESP